MAPTTEFDFGVGNTRLSLAYGGVDHIPSQVIMCVGERIQSLDLSHNDFRSLEFLKYFPALQTLVLDRNCHLNCSTLPLMKNLRILWLNNCNLVNIGELLNVLQQQCPNLVELSMMCNPVGNTVLNGVTAAQERKYRKEFIKALPRLRHFDDVAVSEEERRKALKPKKLSLLGKVVCKKFKNITNFSLQLNGKASN